MKFKRSWLGAFLVALFLSLVASWNAAAAPRSPLPLPVFVVPLYHESFDGAYYNGATDAELAVGNYTLEESWSGYALQRAGTSVTPFVIPGVNSTGHTNINSNAGAVRFWFKPYWSSVSSNGGTGPGTNVTLLELDAVANNQSALVWSLQASADGTRISLIAQTDSGAVELLNATTGWQAGVSHLITLDYSPTGTALFIDGTLAGEGAGTLAVPPNVAALVVGSALDGANAAGGDFDEVGCFGRALTGAEVVFYYNACSGPAAAGPVRDQEILVRAALGERTAFAASLMGANEAYGASSVECGCVTGGQVYFTNFSATLTGDQSMSVSFCIEGGTNWVLYGVYSSTNLASPKWRWVTNVYTCSSVYLTNQPPVAAYYMVRPPPPTMVVAWGNDLYDQCEVPYYLTNAVAVVGGSDFSLALRSDGTILGWGDDSLGQLDMPASTTNVVAIAAGWEFSVALRADGNVIAWGYNDSGQITVPTGLRNVVAIAAAQTRTLALRSNGTMVVWGWGPSGEASVPAGVSNVIAVAAGGQHNLALLANGTVTAWGLNDSGQTTIPAGLSNVVEVAAGWHHSLALKSDGTVVGWGDNEYNEINIPSGLSNVVAIAADDSLPGIYESLPYSLALLSDGTVVAWGSGLGNWPGAATVPSGLDGVVTLGRAFGHALALRSGRVTPVITLSPTDQYQIAGGSATFTARGQGLAGVQYQWQFNGTNISGATNATVTPTNVNAATQGNYRVIVSDGNGSITSSNASFVLVTPPVIISQTLPTNQVVGYPTNLVLNIVASAPGQTNGFPLHYQWQHNGTNVGLNRPSYTNLVTATEFGTYSVVVSNAAGSTNATWEVAEIYPGGILIAHQPTDQYQIAGGNVTFVSLGVGDHPVTYQWEFNGTNVLAGATNASLTLTNVQAAQEGRYNVVVNNVDGTLTSSNAYFHLVTPPIITSQTLPTNQVFGVVAQTNLTLSITADAPWQTNGFPLRYQWRLNGADIAGANTNYYAFTAIPDFFANYSVVVTNVAGSTSAVWQITVTNAINVTNDLLIIYNTNSADSIWVKDYYLAHRPMVSGANVLAIGCTTNPTILREDYTNKIAVPVQNWLSANPTKRPQYVILMAGIPWRVGTNDSPLGSYYPRDLPSVQYQLHSWCFTNWQPFVTSINMGEFANTGPGEPNYAIYTNACKAYIDKLEFVGTNFSSGKLIISAGDYGNTNYYFDDAYYAGADPGVGNQARLGVLSFNPTASVVYTNGADYFTNLTLHLRNGTNVSGYFSWGSHSALGNQYAIDGTVKWYGNSGWWIIKTDESFNGQPGAGQGEFFQWFSAGAFEGTNYSNTPVGAVTHVDEPFGGRNDPYLYFGLWESKRCFAICAWNSQLTIPASQLQVVGDPFTTK